MDLHTKNDELILHRMYASSGVRVTKDFPDAMGITVVQTEKGNAYHFPFSSDSAFVPQSIRTLTDAEDTHIRYLIHVWKDHTLDVPAHSLRQALLELHPKNKDALLMLAAETGFRVLPLGNTMQ